MAIVKSKKQVKAKKIAKKTVAKKAVVKKVVAKPVKKAAEKVEAKVAISSTKGAGLNASVYDMQGKVAGHFQLPEEIFGAKINNSLMSQAVRVYLANQRLGTAKIKDRSEVDRTTKKIYQQKGTGQARHGSRRAPIYVGGGKVFGPTPRDFSLNISKKMKKLALFSALSSKLKDNEVKIITKLETIEAKTKKMAEVLKNLQIKEFSKVLLVMPKISKELENVNRAARNIKGVEILSANSLNVYRILDNSIILMMKDSVEDLKNTFINTKK
jgi:large subunit ribosomal protein L4